VASVGNILFVAYDCVAWKMKIRKMPEIEARNFNNAEVPQANPIGNDGISSNSYRIFDISKHFLAATSSRLIHLLD